MHGTKSDLIHLSEGLTIHHAQVYETNSGLLRVKGGYVLIDPAFTPQDFARIAAFISPEPVLAGFSTHAHYDHLFWSPRFGDNVPRFASSGTVEALASYKPEILAELTAFETAFYSGKQTWNRDYLFQVKEINREILKELGIKLEVHDIPGHLKGQAAFSFPDHRALFMADTLSDVEPPSIEGCPDSINEYLKSLDLLEGLIRPCEWIVPGHGSPAKPEEALRRLSQDRAYLLALAELRPSDFGRTIEELAEKSLQATTGSWPRDANTREIHVQNLKAVRAWFGV